MLGALAGDIIGSIYEWHNIKVKDFPLFQTGCRFTDDTVLTCAVAESLLLNAPYAVKLKEFYRLYPDAGYGPGFEAWGKSGRMEPYNSWGNGSAMRVSPIGYAFNTLAEVLREAGKSAAVTHNHPEGIKGARATAAAVFLARQKCSKAEIKSYLTEHFGYDLQKTLHDIRPDYVFDVSCPGSVPVAILAFLEGADFEDAIRNAISVGGDSDTIACITGGIAEAYFGIPNDIRQTAFGYLDQRLQRVAVDFAEKYLGG